jgi:hypothetical protein
MLTRIDKFTSARAERFVVLDPTLGKLTDDGANGHCARAALGIGLKGSVAWRMNEGLRDEKRRKGLVGQEYEVGPKGGAVVVVEPGKRRVAERKDVLYWGLARCFACRRLGLRTPD